MFNLETRGFRETLDQLKDIDPELRKELFAKLRKSAKNLQDEARDYVDSEGLSGWKGWRGGYDAGAIGKGIKITRAKRRKRGTIQSNVIGVENTTAAGVIWELAGRRSNGAPPRPGINPRTGHSYGNGVGFVQAIRSKSQKRASRIVWGAWDSKSGFHIDSERDELEKAIERATRKIESRLGVQ
jgi:hypothetical protein